MGSAEERLAELGYRLPAVGAPMAQYLPAKKVGRMIYVSGQGPYLDGKPEVVGQVGGAVTPAEARGAARLAALNGLAAVRQLTGSLDVISQVVYVRGFVNSVLGFTEQPAVIDGASELLVDVFGERGRHARAALGTSSLPGNLPVEIEMIFEAID